MQSHVICGQGLAEVVWQLLLSAKVEWWEFSIEEEDLHSGCHRGSFDVLLGIGSVQSLACLCHGFYSETVGP